MHPKFAQRVRPCSVCGTDTVARSNHPRLKCPDCKNPLRVCEVCDIQFRPTSKSTGRWCSMKCSGEGRKDPSRIARLTRRCPSCGESFFNRDKKAKYCSRSCHLAVWNSDGPRGKSQGYSTGKTKIDHQGYVDIKIPGHPNANRQGWLKEHRYVMSVALGRPLHDFENVHHLNGIRSDNRRENLELWTKPQPIGQRPEDLAEWVVDHYSELVEAALAGRAQLRLAS